jgi:hypothetical protein
MMAAQPGALQATARLRFCAMLGVLAAPCLRSCEKIGEAQKHYLNSLGNWKENFVQFNFFTPSEPGR